MSVAEAVYGTLLTLPGDFLDSAEFPPKVFLQRVEKALAGFSTATPHIRPESPKQLPPALLQSEFVFVREDAVTPPLSPLYRGPYRVLKRSDKLFVLQIGEKEDSVFVDRLKPVFSTNPVVPAVPPTCGRPRHHPADRPSAPARPAIPSSTTVSLPADDLPVLQRRNPRRLVRDHTSAPFSSH